MTQEKTVATIIKMTGSISVKQAESKGISYDSLRRCISNLRKQKGFKKLKRVDWKKGPWYALAA